MKRLRTIVGYALLVIVLPPLWLYDRWKYGPPDAEPASNTQDKN